MKKIFYIFLLLILGIIIFVWYAGAFEKVTIIDAYDGPYVIVGLDHKGSYSEIPAKFEEVYTKLDALNIKPKRTLGKYFDNPSKVKEAELRSFAAAIIEGENLALLNSIPTNSLTLDTIPKSSAILVDLPARSVFCYMIYPMKVYPMFDKWNADKGYTASSFAYEVYDEVNKKVRYVMPYSK